MEVLFLRALVPVLLRLKLSTSDILQGKLDYTELPWQVPPLKSDAKLGDAPVQDLLDCEATANEEALYTLWSDGMADLMNHPKKVVSAYGYKSLHQALDAPHGERAMRFSRPQGFPDQMSEYAGGMFSLEAAHTCKLAGLASELHESDSDYWVRTPAGYEIGVRDGLPILGGDQWDTKLDGIVPELLRMPRGDAFVGCDYDLVSRLRSLLYTYRDRVPDMFEAADLVLQGMRVVAYGKHLPRLLMAVRKLGEIKAGNRTRLQDLKECFEVVHAVGISDRQKMAALKGLLVPAHMGKTAFSREVFPFNAAVPAVLSKKIEWRIKGNIEDLYRIEESRFADQT